MSMFTDQTPTTGDGQNTGEGNQQTIDYLEAVTKEKGEQWKDPTVLAKGYFHAQKRIEELEASNKDNQVQDFAKQLLETVQAQTAAPATPEPVNPAGSPEGDTPLDSDKIKSLVTDTIVERERSRTVEQNIAAAESQMVETFGANAPAHLSTKASELGMSKERLQAIAGESPTAFMSLMGAAPKQETNSVVKGEVNTSGISTSGKKGFSYYKSLPLAQFSNPKTQAEMVRLAKEMGPEFYKL